MAELEMISADVDCGPKGPEFPKMVPCGRIGCPAVFPDTPEGEKARGRHATSRRHPWRGPAAVGRRSHRREPRPQGGRRGQIVTPNDVLVMRKRTRPGSGCYGYGRPVVGPRGYAIVRECAAPISSRWK